MARRKMMILLRFWKLISHGDVTAIAEARDGTEEDDDIVEVLETDFRRRCRRHHWGLPWMRWGFNRRPNGFERKNRQSESVKNKTRSTLHDFSLQIDKRGGWRQNDREQWKWNQWGRRSLMLVKGIEWVMAVEQRSCNITLHRRLQQFPAKKNKQEEANSN